MGLQGNLARERTFLRQSFPPPSISFLAPCRFSSCALCLVFFSFSHFSAHLLIDSKAPGHSVVQRVVAVAAVLDLQRAILPDEERGDLLHLERVRRQLCGRRLVVQQSALGCAGCRVQESGYRVQCVSDSVTGWGLELRVHG